MQVITKEVMNEKINEISSADVECGQKLNEILSDAYVEMDHLTVSMLRPMVDAPKDETPILAYYTDDEWFVKAYFMDDEWCVPEFEFTPKEDDFTGWLPMPVFSH